MVRPSSSMVLKAGADQVKLAIFISGRGSNMVALLDYVCQQDVPVTAVLVLADGEATGLATAAERGIPTVAIRRSDFSSKQAHEAAVIDAVEASGAEMIALAGYMRLLSADFCSRFSDRIINIHPSLLPRYKGLETHRRALEAGDTEHGCSIHLVTAGMDEGPVIAQATVPVQADDTPETLAKRVLVEEHKLYSLVIGAIAAGHISIDDGRISAKPGAISGTVKGVPAPLHWPPA